MDNSKKMMARKSMLKSLSQDMRGMFAEGRDLPKKDKLMKVSVMSDSEEGIKKGLSKAEEIMKKKLNLIDAPDKMEEAPEMEESEEGCAECEGAGCPACEESEGYGSDEEMMDESSEDEDMSSDMLKQKIEELQKKLSKKMK